MEWGTTAWGGLIDKLAAGVQNGTNMILSARNFLAGGFLLLTLPAAHAEAALERAQFDAVLMTARDYADDRSLIFYSPARLTKTVPFLYAGLQADLEQAVQKRNWPAPVPARAPRWCRWCSAPCAPRARGQGRDALDRRCISKDVERSRAEVKGVACRCSCDHRSTRWANRTGRAPLQWRVIGPHSAMMRHWSGAARANQPCVGCAGSPSGRAPRNRRRHKRPEGPTACSRGRALFLFKTFCEALLLRIGGGRAVAAGGVAGVAGVAGGSSSVPAPAAAPGRYARWANPQRTSGRPPGRSLPGCQPPKSRPCRYCLRSSNT